MTLPIAHPPAASAIPSELRTLPAWLMWRYEPHEVAGKKPRKVPVYADGARRYQAHGTSDDRSRLVTFREAARALPEGHGLGIAMLHDWGMVGLDFDNVVDAGVVRPDVEALVSGTYAEISPSGTGVRAFMRGEFANRKTRSEPYGFETFHSTGFLTITGNVLPVSDLVGAVTDLTPEMRALCAARFGPANNEARVHTPLDGPDPLMTHEPTLGLSVNELRVMLDAMPLTVAYDDWLRVGMALHHETGGDPRGLDLWDEWSSRDDRYIGRHDLEHRYAGFGRGGQSPVTARFLRRHARAAKPETLVLDPKDPMPSAEHFVQREHDSDHGRTLHHMGGLWYSHVGARYDELPADTVRAATWRFLSEALRSTKDGVAPYQPQIGSVSNVIDALKASAHVRSRELPFWIEGYEGPAARDICSMTNGLLHLPTRQLVPHTPGFFNLNALPFAWEPRAPRPDRWLRFLDDLWHDDPQMVEALQELFGYVLTTDTSQQKIFLLLGPKRSGKGTILRVLDALLGRHNIASPTLSSLAGDFGLQQLLGKQLAVIPDARIGKTIDTAIVTERLLMISGEDAVTVDRKHTTSWTGQLPARILIVTNEMPRFGDASGAIASRFIVLETRRTFFGREDRRLHEALLAELPGILLWALDGRERLERRGHFLQPDSAAGAVEEFEELNSPIGEFVKDRCELGGTVECSLLFDAWRVWCAEQGRDSVGTLQSFARDLRASVAGLHVSRHMVDGERARYFEGVRIRKVAEFCDLV